VGYRAYDPPTEANIGGFHSSSAQEAWLNAATVAVPHSHWDQENSPGIVPELHSGTPWEPPRDCSGIRCDKAGTGRDSTGRLPVTIHETTGTNQRL